MISFSPQISVDVGSMTSIVASFLCLVGFYLMSRKMDKLTDAFMKLTNFLMEGYDHEPREDASSDIRMCFNSDSSVLGVRGTGEEAVSNNHKGVPIVSEDL